MRNRIYILDDAPTQAELDAVKGLTAIGEPAGHPGKTIVVIDEDKYVIPEWALIGDEMNVPEANDHTCWNCGATQPAPDTRAQRDSEVVRADRKMEVRKRNRNGNGNS